MPKLVYLCEVSITNDETGWFMWRFDNKWRNWLIYMKVRLQMTKLIDLYEGSITNDETGWFIWRFDNKWQKLVDWCEGSDNKWRNRLIYVKKVR